jgi:hypothetical protein
VKNFDLTLYDVPNEIIDAANLITTWATRNGWKEWELMGIADRNIIFKLKETIRVLLQ